ncbi:MAG: hypothetical protein AAF756_04080 [Pseudomonadota bacterium]
MIRSRMLPGLLLCTALPHYANADYYVIRSEVKRGSDVLAQSEQGAHPWQKSSIGVRSGSGEFRHTDIKVDPIGNGRVRVGYHLALNEDVIELTFTCELGEEISLDIGSLEVDLMIEDCAVSESWLCKAQPDLEPEKRENKPDYISHGAAKSDRNLIPMSLD